MGKYDGFFNAIDQQNAAVAAALAEKNARGASAGDGEKRDPIRRFEYKKLIDKTAIGVKQTFIFLLMGYKPENGPFSLFRQRATHFNLPDPMGGGKELIRDCAEKGDAATNGIGCPYCEMVSNILKLTNDKAKRSTIYRMGARLSAIANAVPLTALKQEVDREKYPYVPHIVEITERMLETTLEVMDANGGASIVLKPTGGLPFFITVEKTGSEPQNVEYNCGFYAKPTPLADTDEEIEKLYDAAYDLSRVIKFPTAAEEISKMKEEASQIFEIWKKRLTGAAAATTPFEEEEEAPAVAAEPAKKSAVKAPPKKKTVSEADFQ